MKPLSPTEIKALCEQYDLRPSKQYGQNYLLSEKVIEAIVGAGEITTDDTVVEIGPGFGVLTFALAEKAKKVIAFEIEQKLRPYWEEKQKELPNVNVVWGNVLTTGELLSTHVSPPYTVVANLPYQITSQALRLLLGQEHKPEKIVVMLQKEVADRITAGKGDMSLLALSVQYYGNPRIVCQVPKGSFWPMPKVDSAVVAITIKQENKKTKKQGDDWFFKVARAGFAQKRKQLWKNIAHGLHADEKMVKDAVRAVAGNEKVRAEDLSFEEWVELVKKLEIDRLSVVVIVSNF